MLVKEVAPTMLIDVACDVIICYLFFLHNDILLSTCQSHDNSITTYQHCLPRPGIMGGCHCGQRSSCLSSFALARAFQQVLYRLLTASSLRLLGGGASFHIFSHILNGIGRFICANVVSDGPFGTSCSHCSTYKLAFVYSTIQSMTVGHAGQLGNFVDYTTPSIILTTNVIS